MKRYVFCLALISMSTVSLALPAAAATTKAKAKTFCSAQWDGEKKAHTVPRGMTQAKYMRLCTKNYAANATAPADQTAGGANQSPPSGQH